MENCVAKESGQFIQWDQPELVIQAIRDFKVADAYHEIAG